MQEQMALVPEGEVFLCQPEERDEEERPLQSGGRVVRIEAALLDRYPVTNAQFKRFVDAGGYEQMPLWSPEIWQGVFEFVDSTGNPGPKFWKDGTYARGEEDHPVVGVSWYEACAYARWVGKRLPTDAEWVKAGSWPMPVARGLPVQRKFPWGDAWEPTRANIWGAGPGHTTPVSAYEDGASVAGVYGLSGNVWEWTTDPYGLWHSWMSIEGPNGALRSLRGGAFDTYFESQATCQFQSGDSPLARKHNIGFRCALGLCDLRPASGDHADFNTSAAGEDSPADNDHQLVCEEA
jgi:iron(II)-dependent oxidoreductase